MGIQSILLHNSLARTPPNPAAGSNCHQDFPGEVPVAGLHQWKTKSSHFLLYHVFLHVQLVSERELGSYGLAELDRWWCPRQGQVIDHVGSV